MKKIRVLLVDDHSIVRLGLMTLINDRDDMEVVGEAGTTRDALLAVERLKPDVVLMDIRMPGEGGIEVTRQITTRFPEINVVMLTSFLDDELVIRAIEAGARGYVLKQADNEELLRAIKAAASGAASLDPATTLRLIGRVRAEERRANGDAFRDLSAREMDVLAEVARARTNAEIGRRLNLSEKTVGNYVSNLLDKLNLTNRIELATFAVEHRIFDRTGNGYKES
jgi:DNA-binding NarL/FixJ family response regulator